MAFHEGFRRPDAAALQHPLVKVGMMDQHRRRIVRSRFAELHGTQGVDQGQLSVPKRGELPLDKLSREAVFPIP
jgi:hypothetical protein